MNCSEAEARLVSAGDGALDANGEVRLAAHLEGCAACRARAELWRALVQGMRALGPSPPDAMRSRRMQIEIEHRLTAATATATATAGPTATSVAGRGRWPRLAWPAALAIMSAAAVFVLWSRHVAVPPGASIDGRTMAPAFAAVVNVDGQLLSDGHALAPASALTAGAQLTLAGAAGHAELTLGRHARLRLTGPTRLALEGTARDVGIRLDEGTLDAEVAHRATGETFAVTTRDLRVEVRGTHFAVGVAADRSWVRVDEGRVEVRFADGHTRFVAAGETAVSTSAPPSLSPPSLSPPSGAPPSGAPPSGAPPSGAPPAEAPSTSSASGGPAGRAPGAGSLPTCAEARRACEATARAVRDGMRAGDSERALRLLAASDAQPRGPHTGPGCPAGSVGACGDELGYLRAEALRGAGRIDDAIVAYRALDRRGAPPAMRQNALYAAAQLERRQGHAARARAGYERALAVSPRGALRGEAMLGAMDSAAAAGDGAGARVLARRYLRAFPAGLGAANARRVAGAVGGRP